jgi:hypothetical protein
VGAWPGVAVGVRSGRHTGDVAVHGRSRVVVDPLPMLIEGSGIPAKLPPAGR